MAELKPKPLPCPKCGAEVHVRLTGWGLRNWFVLHSKCKCFPEVESKHYWIDRNDHTQQAEKAYREMSEEWNKMCEAWNRRAGDEPGQVQKKYAEETK